MDTQSLSAKMCPNCGGDNSPSAVKCINCGESLSELVFATTTLSVMKKKSKTPVIIGVLGVTGGFIVLCLILVGYLYSKVNAEKAPIALVLDSFMKYMEAKDVQRAYELFSPRAQRQNPVKNISSFTSGPNYAVVEGYESLNVQQIEVKLSTSPDQNQPQGTVANVSGTISYQGEFTGTFTAILEKVDGEWKIDYFNINVPPAKIKP